MAKLLKLRRGTTTQHGSFTGAEGEVTIDTDKDVPVVHDGSTQGGHPIAAEDMSNVSSASIAGRLANDSIAVSKIAAGTLPSDVKIIDANVSGNLTIESADIVDGTIVNADVNGSAAIAGTKVTPAFGSQNLSTSGTAATGALTVTGNIGVSGTVDGRDVAADGTKLDGIESAATADQTAAEIRTLVENATDSNVFTDADHTKLNGIEAGATEDQTGAEISVILQGNNLGTSSSGVHDIYTDNWFRNNDADEGLYNQNTGQHWYSDNANYWNMGGSAQSQGIKFRDNHNSTIRAYIYYTTGNEIGFLNNSGNWSLRCDSSGNVTATGNVTAYSDARLKTNVNTINDALSIVGKLRGVSFDWKESGKHSIGVIAQEVEEVLPEVVLTSETSDEANKEKKEIKSVDYGKIVGVLINAINELKAEVEELKNAKTA